MNRSISDAASLRNPKLLVAALGFGQNHAIVGDCRCNEQRPAIYGICSKNRVHEFGRVVQALLRFRELTQIRRGWIPLSMRHAYIGIGDFERKVLVTVNFAAPAKSDTASESETICILTFVEPGKPRISVIEFDKFIGQLTHLRETLLGNLSLPVRHVQTGREAANHKHYGGGG